MTEINRRNFLKTISLTGTALMMGCSSESAKKLIPYLLPPEDIIPGHATWYATTCRECPAGCGVLAKNREGRVIKVEGNPLHPVNQGRLCPRGQAAVQGIYNPDRIRGPLKRNSQGHFESISWEQAESLLLQKLLQIIKKKNGRRIVFLSDLITGSLEDLIILWLSEMGSEAHVTYEPLTYEPLRNANRIVFNRDAIPWYRIDRADFLISFNADFLETWLSNVEYAHQFATFHAPRGEKKGFFVYVGPRLSLTGANADLMITVPPGREYLVALGMLRILLEQDLTTSLQTSDKTALTAIIKDWPLKTIIDKTGVKEEILRGLAERFSRSEVPLALAGASYSNSLETAVAANLLCTLIPGTKKAIDFEAQSALGKVARIAEMKELSERMMSGQVELLMLYNANPVFSLPPSWNFHKAMEAVPLVVSFTNTFDETSELAHLILPTNTPLESWGDYSPRNNIAGLMQPVMGTIFQSRHFGDILLSTGRKIRGEEKFPWEDFYHLLRDSWHQKGKIQAPAAPPETFWVEAMKRGGMWESREHDSPEFSVRLSPFSFPDPGSAGEISQGFNFITYPTIQFFDGRGASRPWLQELPDPLTQITWGNWLEIHPETAEKLGIKRGDLLLLQTPYGALEVPAYPFHGVHPDTLAMPMGQGHTAYGRFADRQPGNPMYLLSPNPDRVSGNILWEVSGATLKKQGKNFPLANTDGSLYQHGRGLAQAIVWKDYLGMSTDRQLPELRLPLPEGYMAKEDFYTAHAHKEYRWVMVVDLDRCIGCGACAVACSAENNVAIVGREQVVRGREMSWLRIERFFEPEEPEIRFFPMLCQHCDNAPCESVCPVFAPNHSPEGINNQIYNRCIGTRFCSQNCPYKVRRFNWFTYKHAEPLNWQLNPDVTAREKGVMEKCSFCIQRIKEAKNKARDEGRKVRDGEIMPACVQTCPAEVLTFGNLLDPSSSVSTLFKDPRAYQALGYLNTKPAVIYLKKITQRLTI